MSTGNNKEEKNWLIRTRHRQILGPVTKSKIVEFVEKGSLGPEDEVSRGNGYWFAIKEKDLLDKYIFGDVPQQFNPIAEAKTVLATEENMGQTASFNPSNPNHLLDEERENQKALKESQQSGLEDTEGQTSLPAEDDLDYPELGNSNNSNENQSEKLNKSVSESFAEELEPDTPLNPPPEPDSASNEGVGAIPDESDLEYPDFGGQENQREDESFEFELPNQESEDKNDQDSEQPLSILETDDLDDLDIQTEEEKKTENIKKKRKKLA